MLINFILPICKDKKKMYLCMSKTKILNFQIMDLNSIITSLTGNNLIGEIAKNLNIDSNKIMDVIKAAIPKFLGAMQKNVSTSEGAASLTQALGNHAGQSLGVNIEDGTKILSKVFGGNLDSVISSLGKQTGTSNSQVTNILASIAPNLLSVLGKNGEGINIVDLLGSLLGAGSNANTGSAAGNVLGGLLGKIFKK